MSIRLMSDVFDSDLQLTDKMILLAMSDYASDTGDSIFPSIETLSEKTSLSDRAVQLSISRLIEAGFLLKQEGGGRHNTNKYKIVVDRLKGARRSPLKIEKGERGSQKGESGSPDPSINHHLNSSNSGSSNRPNIFSVYEKEIGLLTPMIADALMDAEKTYPAEWLPVAIRQAVAQNVRRWSYVEGILKRWKIDGFQADTRKKDEKTVTPARTARPVLNAELKKKYGWEE